MPFSEPFVESIPQIHFTLLLASYPKEGVFENSSGFFVFSFITSIISGSFGLSKIIRLGPAKCIAQNGKIATLIAGHLLLLLTILLSILSKGLWFWLFSGEFFGDEESGKCALIWMSFSILPHFILVSTF